MSENWSVWEEKTHYLASEVFWGMLNVSGVVNREVEFSLSENLVPNTI